MMPNNSRCNRCKKIDKNTPRPKPGVVPHCSCTVRKCHCGGILIEMTDEDRVKEARANSILPKWCLQAISFIAYEDGHSAGQQEVDNLESDMIGNFEASMRAEAKC